MNHINIFFLMSCFAIVPDAFGISLGTDASQSVFECWNRLYPALESISQYSNDSDYLMNVPKRAGALTWVMFDSNSKPKKIHTLTNVEMTQLSLPSLAVPTDSTERDPVFLGFSTAEDLIEQLPDGQSSAAVDQAGFFSKSKAGLVAQVAKVQSDPSNSSLRPVVYRIAIPQGKPGMNTTYQTAELVMGLPKSQNDEQTKYQNGDRFSLVSQLWGVRQVSGPSTKGTYDEKALKARDGTATTFRTTRNQNGAFLIVDNVDKQDSSKAWHQETLKNMGTLASAVITKSAKQSERKQICEIWSTNDMPKVCHSALTKLRDTKKSNANDDAYLSDITAANSICSTSPILQNPAASTLDGK